MPGTGDFKLFIVLVRKHCLPESITIPTFQEYAQIKI